MSIADNPSSSARTIRLSMPKKDSLMNPNGARLADKPGEQNVAVDLDRDHERCILQSAQTAAKRLLYPSGLVVTAPCTAAIALAHEGLAHEQPGR